jgi:hypothetical protein
MSPIPSHNSRRNFTTTRWPTSYAEMADAVQPDSTTVQQLLKRSRSLWSSYAAATTDLRLPAECIQLRKLLSRVPVFPTSSLQAHNKLSALQYHHSRFGLRISGTCSTLFRVQNQHWLLASRWTLLSDTDTITEEKNGIEDETGVVGEKGIEDLHRDTPPEDLSALMRMRHYCRRSWSWELGDVLHQAFVTQNGMPINRRID